MFSRIFSVVGSLALAAACCGTALAQPGPDYGIDFVTVRAPGNAPINDPNAPSYSRAQGRGGVDYTYRIGRLETTSEQWGQFLNAYAGQASPNPFWSWDGPIFSGIGGNEFSGFFTIPATANFPVTGVTWRMAAMYCNWLTNGQGSNPASLVTGAYDTTTWGSVAGGGVTDAPTHLPGAQFWIPTLDEALKAAYYDPNRNGPGLGGYWTWRNSADGPGVSGVPGVGTTSNGYHDPANNFAEWAIPLGSYPNSTSPWGLLDTSGGAREWCEDLFIDPVTGRALYRTTQGSSAGQSSLIGADYFHTAIGTDTPSQEYSSQGLRIASAVPAPSTLVVLSGLLTMFRSRRRSGV
jgi:formylglycine-generating enzyme required for sulfatase activity